MRRDRVQGIRMLLWNEEAGSGRGVFRLMLGGEKRRRDKEDQWMVGMRI